MIEPRWTHKALAFGVVPVRMDMTDEEYPFVEVRHWSLEPVMDIFEAIYGMLIFLRSIVDSDYEPTYPFKITGEYSA